MVKKLILLMGINGAGKTTLRDSEQLKAGNAQVIDSDNFFQAAKGNWRRKDDRIKAILQADQKLNLLIEKGTDIIWELEAAGSLHNELNVITKAKKHNYHVELIWVTLNCPELALKRVLSRFREGGIGGSQIDVPQRYQRVNDNFIKLETLADQVVIYDNTFQMKKVYEEQNNKEVLNKLIDYPWIKL